MTPWTFYGLHEYKDFYAHSGACLGWTGLLISSVLEATVYPVRSYYVHPRIVPGYMDYHTLDQSISTGYLVTMSIPRLSQDVWDTVYPLSQITELLCLSKDCPRMHGLPCITLSMHGLPSYYVLPGIVQGWMGYRTPCVRVSTDYLVTMSIPGLSQDGWGTVHPVSEYPRIT